MTDCLSTEHGQLFLAVSIAFILALTTLCQGCGAAEKKIDWAALAVEAKPEFKQGPCGPELQWKKSIAAYDKVEIEGTLVIRPHCDPPKDKE